MCWPFAPRLGRARQHCALQTRAVARKSTFPANWMWNLRSATLPEKNRQVAMKPRSTTCRRIHLGRPRSVAPPRGLYGDPGGGSQRGSFQQAGYGAATAPRPAVGVVPASPAAVAPRRIVLQCITERREALRQPRRNPLSRRFFPQSLVDGRKHERHVKRGTQKTRPTSGTGGCAAGS